MNRPPSQWYWGVVNDSTVRLSYWDGNDHDQSPGSDQKEFLLRGRGYYTAVDLKENTTGEWTLDARIPDEIASGLEAKLIADQYLTRVVEMGNSALIQYRIFDTKWEEKKHDLKQYVGRHRRGSAGAIQPLDLR